jgi:diketogulonate reductase-like aldo/keto reductase
VPDKDRGLSRDEVFIATKFLPRLTDPVTAIERSLRSAPTTSICT